MEPQSPALNVTGVDNEPVPTAPKATGALNVRSTVSAVAVIVVPRQPASLYNVTLTIRLTVAAATSLRKRARIEVNVCPDTTCIWPVDTIVGTADVEELTDDQSAPERGMLALTAEPMSVDAVSVSDVEPLVDVSSPLATPVGP